MTPLISKGQLKQLIRQSKWEVIGKLLGFTPVYHFGKIAPPAFFDWRCVPPAVYEILNTPKPQPEPKRLRNSVKNNSPQKKVRELMHEDQKGLCFYCEQPTIEHRHPRGRGGTNHPQNKIGACKRCNNAKGFLTEAEFKELHPENIHGLQERCQKKMKQLTKEKWDFWFSGRELPVGK